MEAAPRQPGRVRHSGSGTERGQWGRRLISKPTAAAIVTQDRDTASPPPCLSTSTHPDTQHTQLYPDTHKNIQSHRHTQLQTQTHTTQA